jgi:hypothetical protein
MAEDEGLENFGGILMIWPSKKRLVRPRVTHDVVNLRILELETAKEILAEIFDTEKAE